MSKRNGVGNEVAIVSSSSHSASKPVPGVTPFLNKCYDMINDPESDAVVSWEEDGFSFVVRDSLAFSKDMLPKYFKHNNFSSFVRQLNTYGFHKVDPDRWAFANDGFVKGQKHLLRTINRKKYMQVPIKPGQEKGANSISSACVEVGKFGVEMEIEQLKRDKNILLQELVKLRQHQQSTDKELVIVKGRLQSVEDGVKDRLQVMEQRQQKMFSFLTMALQRPEIISNAVQQNGNSRTLTEANKKRRLPALEHPVNDPSNGQIVEYNPFVCDNWNTLAKPEHDSFSLVDGMKCLDIDAFMPESPNLPPTETEVGLNAPTMDELLTELEVVDDDGRSNLDFSEMMDFDIGQFESIQSFLDELPVTEKKKSSIDINLSEFQDQMQDNDGI